MTTDTPAAILRDLAALDRLSAAQAAGQLPELSRRARDMVQRWDALQTPPRHDYGCPMCGAAASEACRAYSPESEACYRHA